MIDSHKWDQQQASKWAHELLQKDDWLILDTETTGLGNAEACEIALVNHKGRVILSTLVKPLHPIPVQAIAIHGITNEMVTNAPTFPEVYPLLVRAIAGKKVVIYNGSFDRHILSCCCQLSQLEDFWNVSSALVCAMDWYSQWYGEWSDYHGNCRWQLLPGGDHTALGDCKATYQVIQKMAESYKAEALEVEPVPQEAFAVASQVLPKTEDDSDAPF